MGDARAASVEFLTFLADVYTAGTGELQIDRLAAWLGLTEDELSDRWYQSGRSSWKEFADDILAVLDLMQDRTGDLAQTLAWYRHDPLASCGVTADQMVSTGRSQEAIARLKRSPSQWGPAQVLMVMGARL
jgi:hypothetical protein